jgi:FkbM family methyltransferase
VAVVSDEVDVTSRSASLPTWRGCWPGGSCQVDVKMSPTMMTIDYLKLFNKGDWFFEQCIAHLYQGLISAGDVVIDGGAHIGDHTIPLSRGVGANGHVFAIEALPHLAKSLLQKLNSLGIYNVTIVNKAISDRFGSLEFNWVKNNEGYSGLKPRDYPEGVEIEKIQVDVITIDSLLETVRQKIPFIKLDLEGGEFKALKGASVTLKRRDATIVFENGREWTCKYWDYTKDDFFAFFAYVGYELTDLFLRPLGPETWDANPWPWYFIAVPIGSGLNEQVRSRLLPFLEKASNE